MKSALVLTLVIGPLAAAASDGADVPPCESIHEDATIFLGRFLGAKSDCEYCPVKSTYEYLETLSGPRLALDGRTLEVTLSNFAEESPIQLVAVSRFGGKTHFVRWIRPALDTDPVLLHLRRQRESPRASLTIEVTDGLSPLAGASVTLTAARKDPAEAPLHRTAGADGIARFDDLRPGTYHHSAVIANHETGGGGVTLTAGSCPAETVWLHARNRLSGRLVDSAGSPVPGVSLTLSGSDGNPFGWGLRTGDDGSFEFESKPAGRYLLAASPDLDGGFTLVPPIWYPAAASSQDGEVFTLEADTQRTEILFRLPDLGRRRDIEVEARDASGKPIEFSALHRLRSQDGRPVESSSFPARHFGPGNPLRITTFENLAYEIVPLPGVEPVCRRAPPVLLPGGPKPDKVIVTYFPAPCGDPPLTRPAGALRTR